MSSLQKIAAGAPVAAVEFMGVKVPPSPFLTETRIERIASGRYEGQEIAGALQVTGETDRVLELGAGLGIVGAVIARHACPQAQIAFEANPELIPHIAALYALNRMKTRITLRNEVLLAAADRPEHVDFHLRNSFLGSSLIADDRRQTRTVQIATAGYDDLRESFAPTVLVMDIEGGELDFLEHADLTGLRAMVIEFHPDAYGVAGMRRAKQILRSAGFARLEGPSTRTVWACTREA